MSMVRIVMPLAVGQLLTPTTAPPAVVPEPKPGPRALAPMARPAPITMATPAMPVTGNVRKISISEMTRAKIEGLCATAWPRIIEVAMLPLLKGLRAAPSQAAPAGQPHPRPLPKQPNPMLRPAPTIAAACIGPGVPGKKRMTSPMTKAKIDGLDPTA